MKTEKRYIVYLWGINKKDGDCTPLTVDRLQEIRAVVKKESEAQLITEALNFQHPDCSFDYLCTEVITKI